MNLLELVQRFCVRTALPSPSRVLPGGDEQSLQIVGLLDEVLQLCVEDYNWQVLTEEAVFQSQAGQSQGSLSQLAPGFQHMLSETIYDRTRRLPIWGPRDATSWQAMEALPFAGPFYQFRIRGGELLVFPDMEAGAELAFEYYSDRAVVSTDNSRKSFFSADTDTCLLPASLLLLGLRWKWKEEKGLPYAENRLQWDEALASAKRQDKAPGNLSLNGGQRAPQPGIFVPAGNWNIP